MSTNPHPQSARQAILARVKSAINAPDRYTNGRDEQMCADFGRIPRAFRRESSASAQDKIALFRSRLDDYGAPSQIVTREQVLQTISQILRSRGKSRLVAARDIPDDWLPQQQQGLEFARDTDFSNEELNRIDGVITACTVAIAISGTIVLSAREDGRRALTLVPDYELCIVRDDQIVELFPEAIARLGAVKTTPLTFFSGPSATADIEMIRVQGVHGPRTLDVIIVATAA
jgi:L-lactate dehydrogenase complex protein LldG